MKSKQIICDKNGPLWTLRLNRPDKANALSIVMLEALDSCFTEAANDTDLRVLVITGSGDRVFCAGADLGELKREAESDQDRLWESVSEKLNNLAALTIASINGHCIGGAMTLALGCDIRVSVAGARFSYPVLENGIFPGNRDALRMRELIGSGATAAILLGGEKINTAQAQSWGLVQYVVEPTELDRLIDRLSATAIKSDADHLAAMKRLCRGA